MYSSMQDSKIAANHKAVNEIYLATVAIDDFSLSSGQVSDLFAIAYQCPFVGGSGVYQARALLHFAPGILTYDEYELCDISSSPNSQ